MRNAGLEEAQAGLKISGRNINNLRYTDDTILIFIFTLVNGMRELWGLVYKLTLFMRVIPS